MSIRTSLLDPLELQFAQLREKFIHETASNDRLKWLLIASLFILYFGLVLYLLGQSSDAENRYQQSQSRLAQIKIQSEETRWPQRAASAQELVAQLGQRLWTGETPGLAEAGFERWIRSTFDQYGVDVRQVQLTRGPAAESGLDFGQQDTNPIQRIRAKVISPLNEAALINFLNDAANHDSWLIVEQLIVRPGRNARLEMDIATLYRPSRPSQ